MTISVLAGDCRDVLPTLAANSVHCVVTSPPYYGLRDYGTAQWDGGDANCQHVFDRSLGGRASTLVGGKETQVMASVYRDCRCGARRIDRQLGLEATPDAYIQTMVAVFREVRRVMRPDATLWLNMGDAFADKQLQMMPARLALALQADGFYLRSDIIWAKPNPMPESVTDRPTSAHEHVFLLTKSARYYYDADAVREEAAYGGDLGLLRSRAQSDDPRVSWCAPSIATRQAAGIDSRTAGSGHRNLRNVWTIATAPFSDWGETVRQVRVAWDAGVDGMKRKASPDCPVHAGQSGLAPTASDGGHVVDLFDHTGRSDSRLAPSQPVDCAPIAQLHERETEVQSSDLLGLLHAPSATGHSSQSHRTDLVPATSPACSASAQTADDTARIPASPSPFGSVGHTLGSNSEQDGSGDRPSAQTGDRSADMSSCCCEWYIEKTEKTSHFATFPPDLAERCIKAGCPRDGTVLDPFAGAGTTMLVADRLQRHAIGIELNEAYATMARNRIVADAPLFAEVAD